MPMDGSDPTGSGVIAKSTQRRCFTLAEANRTLPLVQRIVSDVVRQFGDLADMERRRATLLKQKRTEDVALLDRRATSAVDSLNDLIAELSSIGCQLKDPQAGLVDFPTVREGREALLCWKDGEDRIAYWHETYAGFSRRRPVTSPGCVTLDLDCDADVGLLD